MHLIVSQVFERLRINRGWHMRRKYLWVSIISLCTALSVQAAPGDGTFTFRIEGPQEERAGVTTPATNPPRQVAPASLARTPVTSATTYEVQPSDTIWAIAHRFMPANGQANEFQAVASIYRNNPNAFANQNVNNLRRTTLNIPSAQAMAQEDPQVGADLLREGRMTLPPLGQARTSNTTQSASTNPPANNPAQTTIPATQTPATSSEAVTSQNQTATTATTNTEPASLAPREFVARETMLRQGERNFENPTPEDALLKVTPQDFYSDNDGSRSDAQGNTVNSENDTKTSEAVPEVASLNEIDFKVIRELIDSTNKAIEESSKVVDQKLSDALVRSENVATSAATVAAREQVSEVMARYESLISDLQQSNAELRANISKLGKQIDQVRSVSLENSDKLNLMREQFVDVNGETSGGSLPQGPMMWILLGLGLMCLILVSTLFIFKRKSRQTQKVNNEVDDFIDDSPTELISTQVLTPEERATLMKEQEREAHEMAKREVEEELAQEARKALEAENQKGVVEESEVQIPQSMFEQNKDLARKAQEQKEAEQKAREKAFAKEKAEAEKRAQEQAEALAAQQKALDEQRALLEAQTKALNDQKAAFDAKKALDTQESTSDNNVEGGTLVPKSLEVEAPATSKSTNDPESSSTTSASENKGSDSGSASLKEEIVASNAQNATTEPNQASEEVSSDEQELMQSWQSLTKPNKNLEDRLKKSQQDLMKAWEAAAHDDANDKNTLNAWAEALKDDEQQKAHKAEIARSENDKVLSKEKVEKGEESVLTPDEKMEHDLKAALESQKQEAQTQESDDDYLSAEEKAASDWQAALGGQKTPPKPKKPKKLSAEEQMALDWANAMQDQTQSVTTLSEDVRPKTKAPDELKIGADGAQNLTDHKVKPQDTKELTHEVLPEGESSVQALDLQHALIDQEIENEAQDLNQALDDLKNKEESVEESKPQTSIPEIEDLAPNPALEDELKEDNLKNSLDNQEKAKRTSDLEDEEAALAKALSQGQDKLRPSSEEEEGVNKSDLISQMLTTPTDEVLSPEELALLKGQVAEETPSSDLNTNSQEQAESTFHPTPEEEVLSPEEIAALEGQEVVEPARAESAKEKAPQDTKQEQTAIDEKNHDPQSFFNNEKNFDEALEALVKSNEQYYPNVKHQPFEINNYDEAISEAHKHSDLENFKSSFEEPLEETPKAQVQEEKPLDPISQKAQALSQSFKHSSEDEAPAGQSFTWEILDDDNPLIEEFKRQSQSVKALDNLDLAEDENFVEPAKEAASIQEQPLEDTESSLEQSSTLAEDIKEPQDETLLEETPQALETTDESHALDEERASSAEDEVPETLEPKESDDLKVASADAERAVVPNPEEEKAEVKDKPQPQEEAPLPESRLKDPAEALQEDHEALLNMLSSKSVDKSLNHEDIVTSPLSDDDLVNMLASSANTASKLNAQGEGEITQDTLDTQKPLEGLEVAPSEKVSKKRTSRKRKTVKEPLKEEAKFDEAGADLAQELSSAPQEQTSEVEDLKGEDHQDTPKTLSRELKEKLNYDLNLALVFFETGDQDEARELIDGIIKQGSPDLVAKAKELAARYGA